MKMWFVPLMVLALLTTGVGCQSFQSLSQSAKSLFPSRQQDRDEDLSEEILDPLGARNTNRLLLDDFSPNQIATTLKVRTSGGVDKTEARKSLAEGKKIYAGASERLKNPKQMMDTTTASFIKAANHFRLAADRWPDSEVEEEALFFEGESYFFADRYVQSNPGV